jgi:hypothetical protein
MTQAERRHDRLAVRLSLIISRLVAGETLNMQKLAPSLMCQSVPCDRDFRERLMYLDLEYHQGCNRLRTGAGPQGELDVLTFAYRAGLADIFPGLDRRLAGALLASDGTPAWYGSHHSRSPPARWYFTDWSVPLPAASVYCCWPTVNVVTDWPRTA